MLKKADIRKCSLKGKRNVSAASDWRGIVLGGPRVGAACSVLRTAADPHSGVRGRGQGAGMEEEQELTEGIQRCENLLTLESLDIRGFELTVFSMKSFLIGKVATPFLQFI